MSGAIIDLAPGSLPIGAGRGGAVRASGEAGRPAGLYSDFHCIGDTRAPAMLAVDGVFFLNGLEIISLRLRGGVWTSGGSYAACLSPFFKGI